jgi:LmbE family N-acetylglucosaminyl deacetylase
MIGDRRPLQQLRLCFVGAHPDDETLGMGGTLAKYAREGVATFVVTATSGQSGRYRDGRDHPGKEALGRIREAELRAAARVLGVSEVTLLGYMDGALDRADPREVTARLVTELRRLRPHVVATFDASGAYGHPDHIAISQLTSAAVVAAADASYTSDGIAAPHRVSKLYFMTWSAPKWDAYQWALKRLVSKVDGVERQATAWPDWAITTVIDTAEDWPTVWTAVQCHESQMVMYERLGQLSEDHHRGLWGVQEFYRAFSLVNGGRERETDLFEGLRELPD